MPGAAADLVALAKGIEAERRVPSAPSLSRLLEETTKALESAPDSFRPYGPDGLPGGIVNLDPAVPVLILPDIHTRTALLRRALTARLPGLDCPLAGALESGDAALVVLGDVLHSETGDAPRRWRLAFREFTEGFYEHRAMDAEMTLALGAVRLVLELQIAFPGRFVYLKGNHDNAANRDADGEKPFGKFAYEGAMTESWLAMYGGARILEDFIAYERALPLLARGASFCTSHAEPAFTLTADDILAYRFRADVVEALTWTDNDAAVPGSVARSLEALLGKSANDCRWITGHRPVSSRYAYRADGLLVQIHDRLRAQGAWLSPDRLFDPERDIVDLADY